MNSRIAIGDNALALKADHGFALGVREMKVFMRDPYNYLNIKPLTHIKLTREVVLGQAFHNLLLQNGRNLCLNHHGKVCLNTGKTRPLTQYALNESVQLNCIDMWRLERMLASFKNNSEVRALFGNTLVNKMCGGLFVEQATGCECFFNADFVLPQKGCVVDVKTCSDVSWPAVENEIWRWQYHWQAWWAKTGAGFGFEKSFTDFVFIFVSQNAPFDVAVYRASPAMLQQAQSELLPFMHLYDDLFETGCFTKTHKPCVWM